MTICLKPNRPDLAHHGSTIIGFNWIGGKETEGDLPSFESRSPVDKRDVVGIFPECGARDIERAVKAAREGFKYWSSLPVPHRGEFLLRIGRLLRENQNILAHMITREVGKPQREAHLEVRDAIAACEYYAGLSLGFESRSMASTRAARHTWAIHRPKGICALLTDNPQPLSAPTWKLMAAILAGNTVVWKPSEDAPSVAYLLVRSMMDAELPPGVVNVVNGKGRGGCGKHFLDGIEKGFYDHLSFEGSTATGRQVAERCGKQLMVPSLNLSGKSPMIVMEDADLDQALEDALMGAFQMAGQYPSSLHNLILHRPIAQSFQEKFLSRIASLPIGNPITHEEVLLGPMINMRMAEAFDAHLEEGSQSGARLLLGGSHLGDVKTDDRIRGDVHHGLYRQPTVWESLEAGDFFQAEVHGPTVNLQIVEDLDGALALAEATPFGLAASIYSSNRYQVDRFKLSNRAASLFVNLPPTAHEMHLPGGGNRHSGNGTRNGGPWGLDACTSWTSIYERSTEEAMPAPKVKASKPTQWDKLK